jgi:hypothetical protein
MVRLRQHRSKNLRECIFLQSLAHRLRWEKVSACLKSCIWQNFETVSSTFNSTSKLNRLFVIILFSIFNSHPHSITCFVIHILCLFHVNSWISEFIMQYPSTTGVLLILWISTYESPVGDGIGAEYPLSREKGDPNVPEENCCACESDMQSGDGLASAKLLRIQQHDVWCLYL